MSDSEDLEMFNMPDSEGTAIGKKTGDAIQKKMASAAAGTPPKRRRRKKKKPAPARKTTGGVPPTKKKRRRKKKATSAVRNRQQGPDAVAPKRRRKKPKKTMAQAAKEAQEEEAEQEAEQEIVPLTGKKRPRPEPVPEEVLEVSDEDPPTIDADELEEPGEVDALDVEVEDQEAATPDGEAAPITIPRRVKRKDPGISHLSARAPFVEFAKQLHRRSAFGDFATGKSKGKPVLGIQKAVFPLIKMHAEAETVDQLRRTYQIYSPHNPEPPAKKRKLNSGAAEAKSRPRNKLIRANYIIEVAGVDAARGLMQSERRVNAMLNSPFGKALVDPICGQ